MTQFELLSKVTSRGIVGAQAQHRSHLEWLKKCKHCPVTSAGTEEVQARPSHVCRDWRSANKAQLHLQGLKKCKQGPVTSARAEEVQARASYICRDWWTSTAQWYLEATNTAPLHLEGLTKFKYHPDNCDVECSMIHFRNNFPYVSSSP
jgi:hypothetical protein